ncbi:DMT family transporter [Rhodospirillum sp. A1_3_36]|uniref:DMT family transporter n=1 Tax=Rhodospirillum sp. A1_3_36 TaxID=3391666 RepID=UPI0039A46360
MADTGEAEIGWGLLFGTITVVIWSGYMVVSAAGVRQGLGSLELTALRAGVSGVAMLPFVLLKGRRRGGLAFFGLGWRKALVLALCAGPPYSLGIVMGLSLAPASHGTVVTPGLIPVFGTLLAAVVLKQRPGKRGIFGLAIVVAGVLAVGWDGLSAETGNATWLGDLLFAAVAFLWAVFTVCTRAWGVPPLHAAAAVSVLSLIYMPLWWAWSGPGTLVTAPWTVVVFQGVYQGLLVAILAMVLYAATVQRLGVAKGALFPALVPVVGSLLAIAILNEDPGPGAVLGMVLAPLGMALAFWPKKTITSR